MTTAKLLCVAVPCMYPEGQHAHAVHIPVMFKLVKLTGLDVLCIVHIIKNQRGILCNPIYSRVGDKPYITPYTNTIYSRVGDKPHIQQGW